MPRPTKDTQLEGLEKLRQIAERDPMKALEAFVGKVVNPPVENGVDQHVQ